jgi:glycosyltransferase involved in cell wall biosynthesis/SAM-dependent methyltransferase
MPDERRTSAVSVLVPFWNVRAFLPEAIESVFAQTFAGWELLLIDDGSTDGSTDVAKAWAARAPDRVRYLEHEQHRNRGVAASRNLGIREARGRYVAFLDADDVWFPPKLERQVAILDAEPRAAMVCGPSQFWYSWTGRPEDRERDYVKDLRVEPGLVAPPALLIAYLTRGTFVANPSTILIRREVLDRVGGFEESFLGAVQTWEDVAFLSKIQLRDTVLVATECWSRYRRHEHSLLSVMSSTGHMEEGRLFFLRWLERYLTQQQVDSPAVWEAHRRALWPFRHPVLHRLRTAARAVSRRKAKEMLIRAARRAAPRRLDPPLGGVEFGDLRRVSPIGRRLGRDRGLPIDRYYIERFLSGNAERIAGHVLEIGDDRYTRRFGGDRVNRSDVLHVTPDNPRATIVADLTRADHIPSNRFDCIILTQTLTFIYDVRAAVATLFRILKPGGVVLATMGGVTQTIASATDRWDYCWGFSARSSRRLFEEQFAPASVFVESFGNVLAATAFLQGLAAEDLRPEELDHRDNDYEFLIAVTAVKPAGGGPG